MFHALIFSFVLCWCQYCHYFEVESGFIVLSPSSVPPFESHISLSNSPPPLSELVLRSVYGSLGNHGHRTSALAPVSWLAPEHSMGSYHKIRSETEDFVNWAAVIVFFPLERKRYALTQWSQRRGRERWRARRMRSVVWPMPAAFQWLCVTPARCWLWDTKPPDDMKTTSSMFNVVERLC